MQVFHEVKIHEEPFQALYTGVKNSEVRKDDRAYAVGDVISLHEYRQHDSEPTGRVLCRIVTHVQHGYDLPEGVCVLSYGAVGLEQANTVVHERSNGSYSGLSASKGGRAWVDGEWCLDELEALCELIRATCIHNNAPPQGVHESVARNIFHEQEIENEEHRKENAQNIQDQYAEYYAGLFP